MFNGVNIQSGAEYRDVQCLNNLKDTRVTIKVVLVPKLVNVVSALHNSSNPAESKEYIPLTKGRP